MAVRLGQETQGAAAAVQADGFLWGEGSQSSAGSRGRGWTLIEGAVIGNVPSPGNLVLLNPRFGLALFQLEAHWTENALAQLEQRLAASGFHEAFPGRLPIIHRRLRREVIPELPAILEEAFSLQPALTLPEGSAWVQALRTVLTDAGARLPAASISPGDGAVTGMAEAPAPPPRPPATASMPAPPPSPANDDAPRPGSLRGLIATAGAVAAGVLLVMVLRGGEAERLPTPSSVAQQVAANTHAATRTDAAPALPAATPTPPQAETLIAAAPPPAPAAEAPPVPVVAATLAAPPPPVTRFEEPPPPRIEVGLAAPPPPVTRFEEPPPPRIEVAMAAAPSPVAPFEEPPEPNIVAALAAAPPPLAPFEEPPEPNIVAALAAAPPPVAPFEEPPEPNIAVALAAAPPAVTPFEEPPEPNIAAALAAAPPPPNAPFAEPPEPNIAAALAAAPPPPIAPFAEPPEPNIAAALAAAPPPPIAPFEEPPEPNIAAALAATPAEGAMLPLPEEPPSFDLEAAIRSLGPPPERPVAAAAAPAPPPAPAQPSPTPPARAQPAASAAAEAPPPVSPLAVPDPPAVIGAMLLRGEALLAIGDISGARRFFERAAASGSGVAALHMGATYDPAELARIGVRGIPPDPARSLAWYRHAARLGEPRAAQRIATLEAMR